MALVQSDVKDGFAEWLPGGMEEARKRFGPHCAAGKFGVVKKDGSAPRLVGDSSISNVNGLCRIREKILNSLGSLALGPSFLGMRIKIGSLLAWISTKRTNA